MPLNIVATPDSAIKGAFSLEADKAPAAAPLTPEESRYARTIAEIFRQIERAEAEAAAETTGLGTMKAEAKKTPRKILVDKLTADAQGVLAAPTADAQGVLAAHTADAFDAVDNAAVVAFGRYRAACDLIDQRPFEVQLLPREGLVETSELKITVVDAADESAPQPSAATNVLFTAIGVTSSVFDTVLMQDLERRRGWWRGKASVAAGRAAATALHSEFIKKLSGVAEIGLRGARPELGKLALDDLREQYLRRVAPAVKNRHMAALGAWCLVVAVAALVLHNATTMTPPPFAAFAKFFGDAAFWAQKRAFFLLIAGSSVGAWASFAMRNETLAFTQLASPQADMLRPFMRVAFVTALTSLVGLILWTGFLTFSIGGVQVAAFRTNGSIALLLGALCGLSERALSTALVNQSNSFARNFEPAASEKSA